MGGEPPREASDTDEVACQHGMLIGLLLMSKERENEVAQVAVDAGVVSRPGFASTRSARSGRTYSSRVF